MDIYKAKLDEIRKMKCWSYLGLVIPTCRPSGKLIKKSGLRGLDHLIALTATRGVATFTHTM